MTLDLKNIEMGMSNGADAVNSNFQAIQSEVNQPQIKTQNFQADNHSQWADESGIVTKQGRIVTVQFRGTNANNSIGTMIATLPSWAKPMRIVYGVGFETDGAYHNWRATNVWVDASGVINSQNDNAYSFTQFTITYLSAS